MTKPIATSELVAEAAEALMSVGSEISVITVQRRIGGGSFSTIKRYLDVWRSRHDAAAIAPELPPDIDSKGREWMRMLWALASQLAQQLAQGKAVEVGRLSGEAEALRTQLGGLLATLGALR